MLKTLATEPYALKMHITVRDSGLELRWRSTLALHCRQLLSARICFYFFLGWHFRLSDQSAQLIIVSCTPWVCMLTCACASEENPQRSTCICFNAPSWEANFAKIFGEYLCHVTTERGRLAERKGTSSCRWNLTPPLVTLLLASHDALSVSSFTLFNSICVYRPPFIHHY